MIDELDQKLILALQRDGRMSYCNLGEILGVTEGTIRHRFKRLTKAGIINSVAVPNVGKLGYNFVAIVGIQVSMADLRKVWDTLCQNPAVCQLTWVTGRYDLIAVVFARSAVEFSHCMVNELSVIPSVIRTETFVSLGMSKGIGGLADTTELVRRLDVSPRKRQ